ncbi:type II toxin-antitoxin system RelE/ParE family toxin [Candidatus Dojkabacteria bacterium]|uniref:Type II toxin-antitoxin system RelE/ParE family toxin n=1 Tax=Candidatus Dojkabacteria bacterium TaxID=2099670 RepID=A0A955I6Z0_9BACT|nr:type II toxin-antitoxin system RelE/ParE family toxin [Candidatus Dojkabacteria bacterium]
MRTTVHIHPEAKKEMLALERKASFALLTLFEVLSGGEILPKSKFKKLSGYDLYEFRVSGRKTIYRALSTYRNNQVIILRVFQKQEQKLPLREIKLALSRVNH